MWLTLVIINSFWLTCEPLEKMIDCANTIDSLKIEIVKRDSIISTLTNGHNVDTLSTTSDDDKITIFLLKIAKNKYKLSTKTHVSIDSLYIRAKSLCFGNSDFKMWPVRIDSVFSDTVRTYEDLQIDYIGFAIDKVWYRFAGDSILNLTLKNGIPVIEKDTVTVSWLPNTESDLAGYVVYWGTGYGYSDMKNVGNKTKLELLLSTGRRYYFAVKAYDESGNYSEFSEKKYLDI